MAKYNFPFSFEQFIAVVDDKKAKQLFAKLGDQEDPLGEAFSCMATGFKNKLYHKDAQDKRNGDIKAVRELMKADPSIKARLLALDKAKGL